jgi:hypothetical protein
MRAGQGGQHVREQVGLVAAHGLPVVDGYGVHATQIHGHGGACGLQTLLLEVFRHCADAVTPGRLLEQ